jgi:transposase
MKCSRTPGKKSCEHFDPHDPPRNRANKKRGRGTYVNDRPPVLGTIGRMTGQVRLRVVDNTKQTTLKAHVEQFTAAGTHVYTDEYESYLTIQRPHTTVCHGAKEWARDDDGDGIREVHTNTCEGMWSGLRTFCVSFEASISAHSVGMLPYTSFGST